MTETVAQESIKAAYVAAKQAEADFYARKCTYVHYQTLIDEHGNICRRVERQHGEWFVHLANQTAKRHYRASQS